MNDEVASLDDIGASNHCVCELLAPVRRQPDVTEGTLLGEDELRIEHPTTGQLRRSSGTALTNRNSRARKYMPAGSSPAGFPELFTDARMTMYEAEPTRPCGSAWGRTES